MSGYRADIDGLRAIAVTAVVLFHAGLPPFRSGFTGVDMFFVISGYLIGGIIHRETASGRFTFAGFYARRARRILPALLTVIAATTLAGALLLSPTEYLRFARSALAALFGMSNLLLWQGISYFAPDSHLDPMLMTWSLGVEEQFYLLLPLVLLGVLRAAPRAVFTTIACLSIASLGCCIAWTITSPGAAFYLLPARFWELGVGVLLAVAEDERRVPPGPLARNVISGVGVVLIAIAIAGFSEQTAFPGVAALVPCLGAGCLIAGRESVINRRLLSAAGPVLVGRLSYGWYLWHWPLLALLRTIAVTAPSQTQVVGAVSLGLALSALSRRAIEQPFRRAVAPAFITCVRYGAALAVAVTPLFLIGLQGWPQRFSPELARVEAAIDQTRTACLANYGVIRPDLSPLCAPLDPRPRLALLGDSHAGALGQGLRDLAEAHGYGMVELAKSSCPPLMGLTVLVPSEPSHAAECAAFNHIAFATVMNDAAIRTVLLAGYWSAPFDTPGSAYIAEPGGAVGTQAELFRAAVARTAQSLEAAGKRVILLGDVPRFSFDPGRLAIASLIPLRRLLLDPGLSGIAPWSLVRKPGLDAWPAPGATVLNLADAFCSPKGCRFAVGDTPLFADPHHVTTAGAKLALAGFAP
jgi:peptidoglycan/LPS O-acetylase OafA/YrhL